MEAETQYSSFSVSGWLLSSWEEAGRIRWACGWGRRQGLYCTWEQSKILASSKGANDSPSKGSYLLSLPQCQPHLEGKFREPWRGRNVLSLSPASHQVSLLSQVSHWLALWLGRLPRTVTKAGRQVHESSELVALSPQTQNPE